METKQLNVGDFVKVSFRDSVNDYYEKVGKISRITGSPWGRSYGVTLQNANGADYECSFSKDDVTVLTQHDVLLWKLSH